MIGQKDINVLYESNRVTAKKPSFKKKDSTRSLKSIKSNTSNNKIKVKSKASGKSAPLFIPTGDENKFALTKRHVSELFSLYEARKFDEEIVRIQLMGGPERICDLLKTSSLDGINDLNSMHLRITWFDSNIILEEKPKGFWAYVYEVFQDLMLRILLISAVVQISFGVSPLSSHPERDWIDGLSILFAVVIVVLVSALTNLSKGKKFRELKEHNMKLQMYTIKRKGEMISVKSTELLVGDLIKIHVGCNIPVDGILVEGSEIKVNESSLTGETDLVDKEIHSICLQRREYETSKKKMSEFSKLNRNCVPSSLLLSGTSVEQGQGWMIVMAVGKNSSSGRIMSTVLVNRSKENNKTPLEHKLDKLATKIGKFGITFAILTLSSLLIRFGVNYSISLDNFNKGYSEIDPITNVSQNIFKIILLVISVLVVAIPEGLPLAVTLSLAFSVQKMMEDKNLVRSLNVCEIMGGANYICTDKTGTLTRNIMTVNKLFNCNASINLQEVCNDDNKVSAPEKIFICSEPSEQQSDDYNEMSKLNSSSSNDSKKEVPILLLSAEERKTAKLRRQSVRKSEVSNAWFSLLSISIALNLEIEIDSNENMKNESKTDLALAKFLHNFGVKIWPILNAYAPNSSLINKIPFSSIRKKKTVLVCNSSFPTGYRLFIKGAFEVILPSLQTYICPQSMSQKNFTDIQQICEKTIKEYSTDCLRSVCVAYKDISENEFTNYKEFKSYDNTYEVEENNLTLLAIFGIRDSLRDKVKDSVIECQKAGINVIMITGDGLETAIAISKECNIIDPAENNNEEAYAMAGVDFYDRIEGLECGTCFLEIHDCKCPTSMKEAEFRDLNKELLRKERVKNLKEFELIIKNIKVLARSRPIDKYAMVIGLKALNNIVAVTGDGTNDAQALSTSDIGFAMGISGTDIAKDAADIIILDDNFSSIVKAIIWGRNIYDNVRKFLQFQLTVNLSACSLVFLTSLLSEEAVITPVQMLWINLIIDSLGSLALSTQNPSKSILYRPPYKKDEFLINNIMWKHILFQAMLLLSITLLVFFYGPGFIEETNYIRIKEAEFIKMCFGYAPGEEFWPKGTNKSYIISGITSYWSNSYILKSNYTNLECGNYAEGNLRNAYDIYVNNYHSTVHITMVFNIFILFTLINQINSRVINDSISCIETISVNKIFVTIIVGELGINIMIIEFGTSVFNTVADGLTIWQWAICIFFSLLSVLLNLILKLLKLEVFIEVFYQKIILKIKNRNKVFDLPENLESIQLQEDKIRNYTTRLQQVINRIPKSARNYDSNDFSYNIKEYLKDNGELDFII